MKTVRVELDDLLVELKEMYSSGSLTLEQLQGFLNSVARKSSRKRSNRQTSQAERRNSGNFEEIISYQRSQVIWGTKSLFPETQDPKYLLIKSGSVFMKNDLIDQKLIWDWRLAWLNGLSVEQIAKKFPEEVIVKNLNHYEWFRRPAQPGYYLISWQNPYINFSRNREERNLPDDVQRLPGNLLLEFLITMRQLGQGLPKVYFRTDFLRNNSVPLCLGPRNGQPLNGKNKPEVPTTSSPLMFSSALGGSYKQMIRFCGMKAREYEIEMVDGE